MKSDLSKYNNSSYDSGSITKRLLWIAISAIFFKSSWFLSYKLKVFLLRSFGAQIGKGLIIKPNVNIKYPWKLLIGNHCWIGEEVWIDNLDTVTIKDNVCISQGALLLCGNHDYTKSTFDLIVAPIILEEGAWVGAKAIVAPGITIKSHAFLGLGSIALCDLEPYSIYKGNPAVKVKSREII